MEEESEKMAALKRAYADIILNTAKESAARVLAAERRALGFQQSLFVAKEEALATMLRLKALMEEKIREAEKASVCQAKQIEELELQLGEAEDTIVDLREELKRVRGELIMMKGGSIQPLNEGNMNDLCMVCNNTGKETSADNLDEPGNIPTISNNMTTGSQKTADTHQCCLENVVKAVYPKEFSAEVDCAGNNDLASITWRSKAPELYRKGYTQRIQALEHNLTSKGRFDESNCFHESSKCEPLICTSEKLQIPCKADSGRSDKRATQVKDASMFEETAQQPGCCKTVEGQEPGCCGKDNFKFSSRFSPRKQRTTCNQSNAFSCGVFSDKSMSCSSSSKFTIHDKQNETEAPKEIRAPFVLVATEFSETTEAKKAGAYASPESETLMLNQCRLDTSIKKESMGFKQCTQRITLQRFQKQNQSVCEHEFLKNSLQSNEDVKDPMLSRLFPKTGGLPSCLGIQKDLGERIEVAVASRADAENSDNSNTVKPDTKDIENGTAQTGTEKFLKYTFQRKRKKGSSPIKNEIFPEKKPTLKPKSVDKKNSLPVPSKSGASTDLPRNNRRLVQVARQLISLSEKRW